LNYGHNWAQLGALAALWIAMIVLSEAIPKAVVLRDPDGMALRLARPLSFLSTIFWPIIALLSLIITPLIRLISGKDIMTTPLVTEEELRMLVNVGEEEGLIEHEEREMIEGVFSVSDTLVREVMVPRVDIVSLDVDTPFEEALNVVIAEGHSRIPVFRETNDTIVGILYAKDMMNSLREGKRDMPLDRLMRRAYFVPETMRVGALLRDFQRRKVHIAIVVDEYGGTAGLVTIEDLLEEIVGEIQDEYDTEEVAIKRVSDNELLAHDRVPISEINELTDLELESEESDRIGGYVYEKLGRVPHVGDTVGVPGATIEVVSVQGVRPLQVRIIYQRPEQVAVSTQEEEQADDEST
jgi:putative hemolysin